MLIFNFKTCLNFLILLLFFYFIQSLQVTSAQNKPNIILVLADDIDYKTLSCNGGKSYNTPHIDSMAQQGVKFTECHSSPLCSPSRLMLMTGKYNFRNYLQWGYMDTGQKTIANLLQDAGYATACFGKWQFDGGEKSIKKFGFDSYCVFNAFQEDENEDVRYKNPVLYANGAFADPAQTKGKYGEDIFADSVFQFMTNHKASPFFIYYPMVLAHEPFQPTPDDTAFSTWTDLNKSDTSFYPSMINYMDKKMGQLLNKVKALGIENNTIIIFIGDNGTSSKIQEYEDTSVIFGGKGTTTEYGTHVPMIVYGPQFAAAGKINNDLVDFTDFLPSIASLTQTVVPQNFVPLDGTDFSAGLNGVNSNARTFIFNDFTKTPNVVPVIRWAQTAVYKLYDSADRGGQKFYNVVNDPGETHPLDYGSLSRNERQIRQQLQSIISSYVLQGFAILKKPQLLSVTDSSAVILDSIEINGGSVINNSGVTWSKNNNPVLSDSNYTLDNTPIGAYISNAKRLEPNTVYHLKAYAANEAGIAYSSDISFTTLYSPPLALHAAVINAYSFKAIWKKKTIPDCSYKIDVSTDSSFSFFKKDTLTEGFDSGNIPSPGWTITRNISVNNMQFGTKAPALQIESDSRFIRTPVLKGAASDISFWIKGVSSTPIPILLQGYNGLKWDTIDLITPHEAEVKKYNFHPAQNYIQFMFTATRNAGATIIDDINIGYKEMFPSFVQGYSNKDVKDTFTVVSGLQPGTDYYYRVRVENACNISSNSNVVAFKTCGLVLNNVSVNNDCNRAGSGSISIEAAGDKLAFNWTGPAGFSSSTQDINNIKAGLYHLNIQSPSGCTIDTEAVIKQSDTHVSLTGNNFLCNENTSAITVKTQGNTGVKTYSLSDGFKTFGPQTDSNFIVPAGNYKAIVTDNLGCTFTTSFLNAIYKCGDKNFIIAPNPTHSEFNLFLNKNTADKFQVVVLTVLGKKLFETEAAYGDKIVFGKNFAAGMYIVRIINDGNTETLKVIKN